MAVFFIYVSSWGVWQADDEDLEFAKALHALLLEAKRKEEEERLESWDQQKPLQTTSIIVDYD